MAKVYFLFLIVGNRNRCCACLNMIIFQARTAHTQVIIALSLYHLQIVIGTNPGINNYKRFPGWLGSLDSQFVNHSFQSFWIGHIPFQNWRVFDKPFGIDYQGQNNQFYIVALFFVPPIFGQITPLFAAFKIGVGKVVKYYFILDVKQLVGSHRQMLFKRFFFGIQFFRDGI